MSKETDKEKTQQTDKVENIDPSKMNLWQKLAYIMAHTGYVQKRGKNDFHKYTYAKEGDVAGEMRGHLAALRVLFKPNMIDHTYIEHINARGNREYIDRAEMEFFFINADNPEEKESFKIIGKGQDAGDKGIYKAISGATKYALMKFFLLETGDEPQSFPSDPEGDSGVDKRNEVIENKPQVGNNRSQGRRTSNSRSANKANTQNPKTEAEKPDTKKDEIARDSDITKHSLELLWSKVSGGMLNGFNDWYTKKASERWTHAHMKDALLKRLEEKNATKKTESDKKSGGDDKQTA